MSGTKPRGLRTLSGPRLKSRMFELLRPEPEWALLLLHCGEQHRGAHSVKRAPTERSSCAAMNPFFGLGGSRAVGLAKSYESPQE